MCSLELSVHQFLDEKEFDLPTVNELPTLESILNEDDEESNYNFYLDGDRHSDEKLQPFLCKNEGDVISIHSRESSECKSKASFDYKRSSKTFRENGTVLRHAELKGIAAQLLGAHDRARAGLPTTMSVSIFIAIGTSHGLILVFEPSQALKCCLGSTELGEEHGGVSALALSEDGSKLLAGFAKGHICLFDVLNGKILQHIPNAHTPNTSVLHIKWTDSGGFALISDSGGSVFELSIRRALTLNSYESRCIFSGSRGEVCVIESLIMKVPFLFTHSDDTVIVAMATISKVIIVSLSPYLRVLFSHALSGPVNTLPLLSWQLVVIETTNNSKVIDPVIAMARHKNIYFFQMTHGSYDQLKLIPLQKITVKYSMNALMWLNSRTMALIDNEEKLHLVDVKSLNELEVIDLAKLGLVYASSHFKAIATGGNVSKALALAGDRACYNSVATFGSQILLLGTKTFHVVTMRTWLERVTYFVRQNRLEDALLWLLDVKKGCARAVIGLTHKKHKREKLLNDRIKDLLHEYLDSSETNKPSTQNTLHLKNYYQNVINCLVRVAIESGFNDFVLSNIWDTYHENSLCRGIYLESIEPYIICNEITQISPVITQQFLNYYEEKGYLKALESCIVHLDIVSLDIHQTLTLSWKHGLYDVILYIYTRAMKDYITPLESLVDVLKKSLDSNSDLNLGRKSIGEYSDESSHSDFMSDCNGDSSECINKADDTSVEKNHCKFEKDSSILSDSQIALGNKILVYISCCLAGRAYPSGNIPKNEVKTVKHEVFKCITSLHTAKASVSQLPYPLLRTLLRFDTRELLNVLSIAFEEDEFSTELGLVQRQRVVDILMQVMLNGPEFCADQIGALFVFVSRQINRKGIAISRALLQLVLDELTKRECLFYHQEREASLLELMHNGILAGYDSESLLEKCERAKFYRVCEFLYEEKEDVANVIKCYVLDSSRSHQVFQYLSRVIDREKLSQNKVDIQPVTNSQKKTNCQSRKEIIKNQVVAHAKSLVGIDAIKLANLVLINEEFQGLINDILIALDLSEEKLLTHDMRDAFDFLKALFFVRSRLSNKSNAMEKNVSRPERDSENQKSKIFKHSKLKKHQSGFKNVVEIVQYDLVDDERSMSNVVEQNSFLSKLPSSESSFDKILYPELHEILIKLLCMLHPDKVLSHLKSDDGFRLEIVLQTCKDFQCTEAVAYLLEINGQFNEALRIQLDILKVILNQFCDRHEQSSKNIKDINISINKSNSIAKNNFKENVENSVQTSLFKTENLVYIHTSKLSVKDQISLLIKLCRSSGEKENWFDLLEILLNFEVFLSTLFDPAANKNEANSINSDHMMRNDEKLESLNTSSSSFTNKNTECDELLFDSNAEIKLLQSTVSGFVCTVINSVASAGVPLSTVLEWIIRLPVCGDPSLARVKKLYKDMVAIYRYEATLYSSLTKMIHGEQLHQITQMRSRITRPLAIQTPLTCYMCNSADFTSDMVLNSCGHNVHLDCMKVENLQDCIETNSISEEISIDKSERCAAVLNRSCTSETAANEQILEKNEECFVCQNLSNGNLNHSMNRKVKKEVRMNDDQLDGIQKIFPLDFEVSTFLNKYK